LIARLETRTKESAVPASENSFGANGSTGDDPAPAPSLHGEEEGGGTGLDAM